MAQNLALVRKRIKTTQSISQIAKAMEMVAASRIKRAQSAVERSRPYARRITAVTDDLLSGTECADIMHPYLNAPPATRALCVVISPDRGLCGSLSSMLMRLVQAGDPSACEVLAIGRKAELFAASHGYSLCASFPLGGTLPGYDLVRKTMRIIDERYRGGHVGRVEIIYTPFRSLLGNAPVRQQLLPVSPAGGAPVRRIPFVVEPDPVAVLTALLPFYVEVILNQCLLEAYTAEQAARMVAMQNAKENAQDVTTSLTLNYNKLRQEKITSELLDLANGRISA